MGPGAHAPVMADEEDGDAPLIRLTDDHFAASEESTGAHHRHTDRPR